MSSYFDRMSRCVNDPKEVVCLVRDQYEWYLHKIGQECLVKDLGRFNQLVIEFAGIKDRELCKKEPVWEISEMHSFAHKLAMANRT